MKHVRIPKMSLTTLVSVFALFLFAFGIITGVVGLDFKGAFSSASQTIPKGARVMGICRTPSQNCLPVYSTAARSFNQRPIGYQQNGARGTVVGYSGGVFTSWLSSQRFERYTVNFDSGTDGWVDRSQLLYPY